MLQPLVLESLPNRILRILETSIYKLGVAVGGAGGERAPMYRFLFWPEDSTAVIRVRECPSPGTCSPFPPPPETNTFSSFLKKYVF